MIDATKRRSVLILGCYRHTLPVLRSLAKAGYHAIVAIGGHRRADRFISTSRHVAECWHYPGGQEHPAAFLESLVAFAVGREDICVIWPIGEVSLRALVAARAQLPPRIHLIAPESSTATLCLDKYLSVATAKRIDIPVPATAIVGTLHELNQKIQAFGFPCIVKANDSQSLLLEKKCVFLFAAEDIARHFSRWPAGHHTLVVQKWIEGLRHNCMFVAHEGRLLNYFESCVLRTDRWDYSGLSVSDLSVAPDPRHMTFCANMVAELNYSGPGCMQFLVDQKTQQTTFLEINPRLDATLALPQGCAADIVRSALEAGTCGEQPCDTQYAVGRRRQWLYGDLRGLLSHMRTRRVTRQEAIRWARSLVADFFRADIRTTWQWSDPMPTLCLYSMFLGHLLKSGLRWCCRGLRAGCVLLKMGGI